MSGSTRLGRVLATVVLTSTVPAAADGQEPPSLWPSHPPAYPLFCRGGGPFAFDTLRGMDGSSNIEVAMSFAPAASAAGAQGLPAHYPISIAEGQAKRSAKRAGRTYPNLVDNMQAAEKGKKRTAKRKAL